MPDRLTPTNVAKHIGVSVSTVRRLTGEYADWLSPTATPRPGGTRVYTEQDVEVLSVIVAMRQDGAPEDEIIRAIESGVIPTNVATLPPQPPAAPPLDVVVKLDTQDVINAIERLTATQERQTATQERLISALIWFAAMLVFIVLLTIGAAVGWL